MSSVGYLFIKITTGDGKGDLFRDGAYALSPSQACVVTTTSLIHCSQFPSKYLLPCPSRLPWGTRTLPSSDSGLLSDPLPTMLLSGWFSDSVYSIQSHSSFTLLLPFNLPPNSSGCQGTCQPGKCIKTTVIKKLHMLFIVSSNVCYIKLVSASAWKVRNG